MGEKECLWVWLGSQPWEPVSGQTPCSEGTCTPPAGDGNFLYEERKGACEVG